MSDHNPIIVKLNITVKNVCDNDYCELPDCFDWSKATEFEINNYKTNLDRYLHDINVPWSAIQCNSFFCINHKNEIETFYDNIVSACIKASELHIPMKKKSEKNKKAAVPGWTEYVI